MYVASLTLWSRSFFLRWITADPSPFGNFTPPTTINLVWREPGGSWSCLWPVSDYEWIHPSRCCDTDIYMYAESWWSRSFFKLFFLRWITADPSPLGNITPPMTIDIVWRDPGGFWACLWPVSDYEWIHPSRGSRWHRHIIMYVASLWSRSFFLRWITADPSPFGTSLHQRQQI